MDLVLRGSRGTRALSVGARPSAVGAAWMSRVDLTEVTFCEPSVLVGVAAFVEAEVDRGQFVSVLRPRSRSAANYLARMRLDHVLTTLGAEHDLPQVGEREAASLLELQIFNGSRGAEQLARMADRELRRIGGAAVADGLWEGICETGQNVEQHAGRRFGFVAAQIYQASRTTPRRLLFAVADAGQGIEASLAARSPHDSLEALRMAVRRGITDTEDPARGSGLAEVSDYLRQLGGGLEIVSGTAGLATHAPRRAVWRGALPFRGTLVQGEARP